MPAFKSKAGSSSAPQEAIVVSSGEEAPSLSLSANTTKMKKRLVEAKNDLRDMSNALKEARIKNKQLENKLRDAASATHKRIDATPLADHLNCPICLEIAVAPQALSCGHTLCKDCLVKLLESTRSQFFAGPNALAQDWTPMEHALLHILFADEVLPHPDHDVTDLSNQLLSKMPDSPLYLCPICRTKIANRPVEILALKNIALLVTEAIGLDASQPQPSGDRVWDRFFP